jgi:hypothetical protein
MQRSTVAIAAGLTACLAISLAASRSRENPWHRAVPPPHREERAGAARVRLVLQDDFSTDRRVWPQRDDEFSRLVVRAGRYEVSIMEARGLEVAPLDLDRPAARVAVDVDVSEQRTTAGSGVQCLDAGSAGFSFLVRERVRGYSIWREAGTTGIRVASGRSAAIHRRGRNRIHVVCGPEPQLYVNGVRMAIGPGGETSSPARFVQVGLMVEAGSSPAAAWFDNVTVRSAG